MWKDPLSKGSAMLIFYAGRIRKTKAGLEECHLYDEKGRVSRSDCSLADMWHIGANHKRCKGGGNNV